MEEREPFEVHGLAAYHILEELVRRALAGEELDQLEPLIRAGGQFPAGETGRLHYGRLLERVAAFTETLRPYLGSEMGKSSPVELALGDWKLTGRLDGITGNGLVAFRLTTVKPLDLIKSWIGHLVVNLTSPTKSWLITEDAVRAYEPRIKIC